MPASSIVVEQLVYGSFAFSDRGYTVLAESSGIQDPWRADLLAACRRFGEAPAGTVAAEALFSLRLASGPRAVVGVFPQGCDDRGRPGALAFHALLIADRDFRRVNSDPFPLAGMLRGTWTEEISQLPTLSWPVLAIPSPLIDQVEDGRVNRIVSALVRDRRVALESDAPIAGLARSVWSALPDRVKRRASVATWAFGNDNRFDLVALPRLAGVALDSSYLLPGTLDEAEVAAPTDPSSMKSGLNLPRSIALITTAGLALTLGAGYLLLPAKPLPQPPAESVPRSISPNVPRDPAERARLMTGLSILAARFDVPDPGNPTELMAQFAEQIRYHGAILTSSERAELSQGTDAEAQRALAWHEQITRFVHDQPLPKDFDRLGLNQQVEALAVLYHLPLEGRVVADLPEALEEALSRPGPIVPTPLAVRYPALSEYARFLSRLPRRNIAGRP